jgi:hypothetical protein
MSENFQITGISSFLPAILNPGLYTYFFEDFRTPISTAQASTFQGDNYWGAYSPSGGSINKLATVSANNIYGEVQFANTNSSSTNAIYLLYRGGSNSKNCFVAPAVQKFVAKWRLKLGQTTNCYVSFGFQDNAVFYGPSFIYDSAGNGNWFASTTDSGGSATIDTGVAADTNYHTFTMWSDGAGNLYFQIDNSAVKTLGSHVMTTSVDPYISLSNKTTVATTMNVDYFFFYGLTNRG